MTSQHIQTSQDNASKTQQKMGIIGLAVLPLVLAVYSNNGGIQAIPSVLASGVFPIGFTVLSWGLAAKLGLKLRK